jgi:DNA-binding response OmpR family regulator
MCAKANDGRKASSGLCVYLAEDDFELRTIIALVLQRDGHRVIQARDGLDLMADIAARNGRTDDVVVISDLKMPMIGGLAALRSLRLDPSCPPFILMTAFATPAVRVEAEELGVCALFDKPFDLDELRRAVSVLAEQHAERRARPTGLHAS